MADFYGFARNRWFGAWETWESWETFRPPYACTRDNFPGNWRVGKVHRPKRFPLFPGFPSVARGGVRCDQGDDLAQRQQAGSSALGSRLGACRPALAPASASANWCGNWIRHNMAAPEGERNSQRWEFRKPKLLPMRGRRRVLSEIGRPARIPKTRRFAPDRLRPPALQRLETADQDARLRALRQQRGAVGG